jgi:hypothetical protein
VNGVAGGSQTKGLISSSGTYSAPFKIAPSLIPASGDITARCAMETKEMARVIWRYR